MVRQTNQNGEQSGELEMEGCGADAFRDTLQLSKFT